MNVGSRLQSSGMGLSIACYCQRAVIAYAIEAPVFAWLSAHRFTLPYVRQRTVAGLIYGYI
jgi:hypothetical protein